MDAENNLYRLNHGDLVNLICGLNPSRARDYLLEAGMVDLLSYHGGFQDYYEWNRSSIAELNEMEIYSLYLSIREAVMLS